jgi:hypothetical protein
MGAAAATIGLVKGFMDQRKAKKQQKQQESAIAAENARLKGIEDKKKKRREMFQESVSQAGDLGQQQTSGRGLFGN